MSKDELMNVITKVSFAMDDTRLFLDTHPNCSEAMDFFKKMQKIRYDAIREYTENYGPITGYNIGCEDAWLWNDAHIPWGASKKGGC